MISKISKTSWGKSWYNKNNQLHRLNGPAVKVINGNKYYYIMDKIYYNFIEYIKAVIKYKKDNIS